MEPRGFVCSRPRLPLLGAAAPRLLHAASGTSLLTVRIPANMAGLRVASKAQAEQVRSVAVERLGPALGRLPASTMAAVEGALRLHLDLKPPGRTAKPAGPPG